MPRIDPWAAQYERPKLRTRTVELKDPDWSITFRQPDEADKDLITDKADDLILAHIDGEGENEAVPLVVPGGRAKVSRPFFRVAAAIQVMTVLAEGEEPVDISEIVGWRDKFPHQWRQIKAAVNDLYYGRNRAAEGDPGNASGAAATSG